MKDYIEVQARRKAHELVLLIFKGLGSKVSTLKAFENMKISSENLAAELYEAHGRLFEEEKIKHISRARGHLYELKYYVELLSDLRKINGLSRKQVLLKVDLLDKLLVSMIRSRKVKKGFNDFKQSMQMLKMQKLFD